MVNSLLLVLLECDSSWLLLTFVLAFYLLVGELPGSIRCIDPLETTQRNCSAHLKSAT